MFHANYQRAGIYIVINDRVMLYVYNGCNLHGPQRNFSEGTENRQLEKAEILR